MRLPSFRRLYSSDFDGQYKSLLDKLSGTINTGIEVLYNALNNNITFSDNIACTVATVNATVDTNGTPTGNVSFKLSNNLTVIGVFVINAIDLTSSGSFPPGAVSCSFTPNSNNLVITNIRGLTANHQYKLTIIALN